MRNRRYYFCILSVMRIVLALALLACPVFGQISVGVKFGVPLNDAEKIADNRQSLNTQRFTVGPTVELKIASRVSIEIDALYRNFDFNSYRDFGSGVAAVKADTEAWEFPLLAKYRFASSRWILSPFVDGGFSFDHTSTTSTSTCTGDNLLCGGTANSQVSDTGRFGIGGVLGAGLQFKLGFCGDRAGDPLHALGSAAFTNKPANPIRPRPCWASPLIPITPAAHDVGHNAGCERVLLPLLLTNKINNDRV